MQVVLVANDEDVNPRPLTATAPKSLLPIVNRPVMARGVEHLARAGFKELLVGLHAHGSKIASYFGDGRRWGVQIEYVVQPHAWGTAGALSRAAGLLRETFLVWPADMILDLDIDAAIAYHRAHEADATLILHRPDGRDTRLVRLDSEGRVQGVGMEVPADQDFCYTGAGIFEPRILQFIPAHTRYDVYSQLIPALLAAGVQVHGHVMHGYWNPLDSFQSYQDAQQVFLDSASAAGAAQPPTTGDLLPRVGSPAIAGQQIAPGIWAGPNHALHPSARLVAPVCIGEGCHVGRGVELGPDVVIGQNVVIDDEATIQHSTILDDTYIGRLVNIDNRVVEQTTVADIRTSHSIQIVDAFLLARTSPVGPSERLKRPFHVLIALLLLIVTLPLTIVIGLAVYFVSGGRIFCRSARVGRLPTVPSDDERSAPQTFGLLAFETRRADGTFSMLGQWLDRWELDRLPELWNVLNGDLELVGVKPLLPEEAAQVHEPWHRKRYECPAGLTGLWYVQTGPESELEEVLVADAYYTATHTWRDDIFLLWRTPAAWLRRCGQQPQSQECCGRIQYKL